MLIFIIFVAGVSATSIYFQRERWHEEEAAAIRKVRDEEQENYHYEFEFKKRKSTILSRIDRLLKAVSDITDDLEQNQPNKHQQISYIK